jgi:hypothetical protein
MKMKGRIYVLLAVIVITATAFTSFSTLPAGTDVWLFNYTFETGKHNIISGRNISNNQGYDSQPCFSENGSYMIWSSERENGQTEIYRYDIRGKVIDRITQTSVSEYSPTYMYGNKYISSVVVEKDSTQRLWKYHKINGKSSLLLPKLYAVGYHSWLDENTVFIYQLTTPVSLVVCDVPSQSTKIAANNIGRCMSAYKTEKRKIMLYTQEDQEGKRWIKAIDKNGVKAEEFTPVPCLEGSEDFALDKRGFLIMGSGSKLYSWKIGTSTEWTQTADLTSFGINSISRIAVSPNGIHLALVNNSNP